MHDATVNLAPVAHTAHPAHLSLLLVVLIIAGVVACVAYEICLRCPRAEVTPADDGQPLEMFAAEIKEVD